MFTVRVWRLRGSLIHLPCSAYVGLLSVRTLGLAFYLWEPLHHTQTQATRLRKFTRQRPQRSRGCTPGGMEMAVSTSPR